MQLLEKLARNLKVAREKKGLSQEELAYRADISIYYISKIERAKANPSLDVMFRISKVLNCTIDELIR